MKECFDLEKDSRIWIYGAGLIAENYCQELLKQGYRVEGFIDQNADNIAEICGRVVHRPDIAEEVISRDAVVILSLRNGLQQEIVAERLGNAGFCKLLYLPMHIKEPLSVRKQYRKNYARLQEFDFAHIKNVPIYGCEMGDTGDVVIEKNETKVIVWCPITSLYSGTRLADEIKKKWKINDELMIQYIDKRIEEIYPYIKLFQYCRNQEADPSSYLELQGRITQEEKESLLEDRKRLYEVFEQAYKYEMNFFTDSPSLCSWNESGHFNMYDGLHRALYLVSKGYKEVPIAVSREDFDKYILSAKNTGCDL